MSNTRSRDNRQSRILQECDQKENEWELDDLTNNVKKVRRVSFNEKTQIREYTRYLNNTDSSSESQSSMSATKRESCNVTVVENVEMSLCDTTAVFSQVEPDLDFDDLQCKDTSVYIGDMTQVLSAPYGSKLPPSVVLPGICPRASNALDLAVGVTPRAPTAFNSVLLKAEMSALDSTTTSTAFAATDTTTTTSAAEDSVNVSLFGHVSRGILVESLGVSMSAMDFSIKPMTAGDKSSIMDYHFDYPTSPCVSRSPHGTLTDLVTRMRFSYADVPVEVNDTICIDQLLSSTTKLVLNSSTTEEIDKLIPKTEESFMVGATTEMSRLYTANDDSTAFAAALAKATTVVIDTTDVEEQWKDENRDVLVRHRNSLETYVEMMTGEEVLELSDVDLIGDSTGDAGEDSSRVVDESGGDPNSTFSLSEFRDFLATCQKQLQEDMNEFVEEKFVCCNMHSYSLLYQVKTSMHDFLERKFSNNNLQRTSLGKSRQALNLVWKEFELCAGEIMTDPALERIPRRMKMDLERRRDAYMEKLNEYSQLISEHLGYSIKTVNEKEIMAVIGRSWFVIFELDQSEARSGVVMVTSVQSYLLSHCYATFDAILGKTQKSRKQVILEHLLGDFLSPSYFEVKVTDLFSLVQTLDNLSDLYFEAAGVNEFLVSLNPLDLTYIYQFHEGILTFNFLEPTLSFSLSTRDFKLPSGYSAPPQWTLDKHFGTLSESELKFVLTSVKLDGKYFESIYNNVCDWLKSF